MSRRPPSWRDGNPEWFRDRHLQAMVPGAMGGRLASAAPVPNFRGSPTGLEGGPAEQTDVAGLTTFLFWQDAFTLAADGAQSVTLTYLPAENSESVFLNEAEQGKRGTRYDITDQTLSLLAGTDAVTGDELVVKYAYVPGMPTTPAPAGTAYDTEVLADSPIAYWKLDESGTTVADFTGHGHDGTMSGAGVVRQTATLMPTDTDLSTTFQYLSGSGTGHFTVPDDAAFDTSAFTLEFWSDRGTSGGAVFYEHPGRLQLTLASGRGVVKVWSGGAWVNLAFSNTAFTTRGAYEHFAITYDGANVAFYHDGALYDSVPATTALTAGTADLLVGPYSGIGTVEDDRLQKFAVYGTALSAARISAHYAAA